MASKVIGRVRSWPRGWRIMLSLVIAAGMSVLLIRTVRAVHDLQFELDGDVVNGGVGLFDWADFFTASSPGDVFGGATVDPLPGGGAFTHAALVRDFVTNVKGFDSSDATTYTQGSKDTLPISTGWVCVPANNVTDKDDLMNAYAATYVAANGDHILYFGMERNANTGDANVGFWFLQDEVNCPAAGGAFTGNHQDGDLFIVSAFTNGGVVSNIEVHRWNIPFVDQDGNIPDPTDTIGGLGETPSAVGRDCRDPLTPANDDACATANIAQIDIPWLTAAKTVDQGTPGHVLPTSQFFEGGLNLTQTNLGGRCFNAFLANTRSSQELTATLHDFAKGTIGECQSETETTPNITAPTSIGPAASIPVWDTANVTVDGVSSFTGKVDFFLCGPFAAEATTRCESGGVPAGSKDLFANGTVVSDTLTVTSAGRYCWRADFSASDPAGIPPSSDSRESECFVITPLTAVLVTQAGTGPVDFGQPVTDTATLANTANHQGSGGPAGSTDGSINPTTPGGPAGGTITFTLYKNDCTTLATGTGTNPQIVSPVNGNGNYGPVSFTPDAPGTYHWVANYSGDLPNTIGAMHNGACTDAAESVVVRQIPTEVKTRQDWIPNDTATITSTIGNLAAGGTVAFSLYANNTCLGGPVFTQTVSVPGGSPSAEVSTTNTGVGVSPAAYRISTGYLDAANSVTEPHSWLVVYTPSAADTAHTGKQSACSAERFTINYTNDPGPGTDIP